MSFRPGHEEFAGATASNGMAIDFPLALVAAGQGAMLLDISKAEPVVLNAWYDSDGSKTGAIIPRARSVSGHDADFHNGYVWVTFEANHAILGFPVPEVRGLGVVE